MSIYSLWLCHEYACNRYKMEVDTASGDVNLWQEWYNESDINIESNISCLYQRYQPRSGHLNQVIRDLHEANGHHIHKDTKIVTGIGSTQVIMGLIYALSMVVKDISFWEQMPAYLFHKDLVTFFGHQWTENCTVEFVTSPNNPDGSIRVATTNAPIILWDAVYAWPWYGYNLNRLSMSMHKIPNESNCICIFSFSKSHGLAGQRVGYAMIPPSIQRKYPSFITLYDQFITMNTLGTCRPGEGVCRVIGSNYKTFPTIKDTLEDRYTKVGTKIKELNKEIQILSPKGFPYLWMKLDGQDLRSLFETWGIYTLSGDKFGVSTEYVRMNLMISKDSIEKILAK